MEEENETGRLKDSEGRGKSELQVINQDVEEEREDI